MNKYVDNIHSFAHSKFIHSFTHFLPKNAKVENIDTNYKLENEVNQIFNYTRLYLLHRWYNHRAGHPFLAILPLSAQPQSGDDGYDGLHPPLDR